MSETVKSWGFNPAEILASTRKVKGIFHQPVVDKDGEYITADAMRKSIPDFMHLPALHDFHKERPVGIATKICELAGGKFYFEGVIKATNDCDDVWEKISKSNYDQVSIFGKRTKYNNQCALPQQMRSGPCVTDGVRLDSISVCDENARNPQTSLEVKKANVVFDAEELGSGTWHRNAEGTFVEITKAGTRQEERNLRAGRKADKKAKAYPKGHYEEADYIVDEEKKAETTYSNLQHSSTDYAKEEDMEKSKEKVGPRTVRVSQMAKKKGESPGTNLGLKTSTGKSVFKSCPCKNDTTTISKDVEKSVRSKTDKDATGKRRSLYNHGVEQATPEQRRDSASNNRIDDNTKNSYREWMKDKKSSVEKADEVDYEGESHAQRKGAVVKPKKPVHASSSRHAGNPVFEHAAHASTVTERGNKGGIHRTGHSEDSSTREAENRTAASEAIGHYEVQAIKERREGVAKPKGKPRVMNNPAVNKIYKAEEEMEDDVEKGVRPKITEEPYEGKQRPTQKTRKDVRQRGEIRAPDMSKADEEEMEKGKVADEQVDESYDEEEDQDFEHCKPSDKEGRWNKSGDPNGNVKMSKAKEEDKDGEEDEEEDVEKSRRTEHLQQKDLGPRTKGGSGTAGGRSHMDKRQVLAWADNGPGNRSYGIVGKVEREGLHERVMKKGDEDAASESFNPSTVTKGEQMDETENDVEYVTKALVPIEEIDTIVKARTEEISKAYAGQLDEIKKAYDAKFVELSSKVEKMEAETIRKGGQVVVIPELLGGSGSSMSNADAIARMQAGR